MKAWFWIILIAVQVWVVAQTLFPTVPNLGSISYRYQEREAARHAWRDHPSPTTEAAFQEERRRALQYWEHRLLVRVAALVAVFLAVDAVLIYTWNHGRRKSAALGGVSEAP